MPWDGIRQAVVDGVATGLTAILILLAVGALIGTWAHERHASSRWSITG